MEGQKICLAGNCIYQTKNPCLALA